MVGSCGAALLPCGRVVAVSKALGSAGGRGSGLLRSLEDLGVKGLMIACNGVLTGRVAGVDGAIEEGVKSSKSANETVCGKARLVLGSFGFGGRGGPSSTGRDATGPIRLELSSSTAESESERWSSNDVRGDSGWASCNGSKIDCAEMDDVSVPLLSCGLCCDCCWTAND